MANRCKFAAAVTILSCWFVPVQGRQVTVDSSAVLETLDKNHPRLMLKDDGLENLKARHGQDELLQKCLWDVLAEADDCYEKPMLTYRKIGPRLLSVSRECLRRIYALGMAYRWTGEDKYAQKAAENMLTVCAFNDWNPSHFLDTAEMSHAVGLGYDWLYSYLDAGTREAIKAGLIKNGLEPGLQVYERDRGWVRSDYNWNQVCNGGLIVGALAIAESDPQYAEQIIPAAVRSLPRALQSYGPDGAWGEGPGYWSYATRYTAYGLAALQDALGKDFGLLQIDGLAEAGNFPIYTAGPTGYYLNLADVGERSSRRPMPCMFWLARTFDNPFYAHDERAMLAERRASPQHVVWYMPEPGEMLPARDLDRYFGGPVEVAVFRSAWDDPETLWIGVKAGYNQVNHGHLDLGNFEMDALGVRWVRDLGSDNYNLPGYWDKKRGGQRWNYYRLNSQSHSVPLLGGEDQDPMAEAHFVKFESTESSAFVLIDLTSAYEKFAKKVTRGVAMLEGRNAVLIQDEFEIDNPCELIWAMTTDADITIGRGRTARLTLKGKELIARLLSPERALFSVESAEREPPEKTNKGVRRLLVRRRNARNSVRVAILLSPVWKDSGDVSSVRLQPLAQW
ncbi:MAG: heparinase II/III family protein [Phycisphaerales bacterium]|nr:MAG: heparinase II/III family protein [Phycisphaerales bacterium]